MQALSYNLSSDLTKGPAVAVCWHAHLLCKAANVLEFSLQTDKHHDKSKQTNMPCSSAGIISYGACTREWNMGTTAPETMRTLPSKIPGGVRIEPCTRKFDGKPANLIVVKIPLVDWLETCLHSRVSHVENKSLEENEQHSKNNKPSHCTTWYECVCVC